MQDENETGSNTEQWPEVERIRSTDGVNRIDFYNAILLVEGQPIEYIIDTGSPITIIPPRINPKKLTKTARCLVEVNKILIKFKSEPFVEVKTEESKVKLPILLTENEYTQPLLSHDWLVTLEIGLKGNRNRSIVLDTKPTQQKRRPVPIHIQSNVRDELEKLIEKGHLEKADGRIEN